MSSIVKKLTELAQVNALEHKERLLASLLERRAKKHHANEGRLFHGKPRGKADVARRRELFREWDDVCREFNVKNRPHFLRWMRQKMREYPNERNSAFDLLRAVEEHNRLEGTGEN